MEKRISPADPMIRYTGRVDDTDPAAYGLEWAGTGFYVRVRGRGLKVLCSNRTNYWESRLGVEVNGTLHAVLLPREGEVTIDLSAFMGDGINDVFVFKRQDSSHVLTFHGLLTDGELLTPPMPSPRRMEVYGDSVSAGEVSEAVDYVGKPDPQHNGEYSNVWWSYPWITARLLGAEIHSMAQGGIALRDGTGYFNGPDYLGMLSCWDKARYNPVYGPAKPWNFSRYTPHVVVVAVGQNDHHPENVMEQDPCGSAAEQWKREYEGFIRALRGKYPRATLVLTTTILNHHRGWDDAIGQVCAKLREEDPRVHHFLYSNNGCGTPGHIRKPEAEQMARELAGFIASLGEEIWQENA